MTSAWDAPIGAVLFDMDGLLLDSERLALSILAAAARDLGIDWDEEVGLTMVGRNVADADALLRRHYPDAPQLGALPAVFRARYDEHIAAQGVALKPGVIALLDLLDRHDTPRAVATSTQRERALRKLTRVDLLRRFHGLVGGDEVETGKPAPDIFLAAAAALEVAPAECLVLEDSNAGVRGALAAGMRVAMVPDMLHPDADLPALGVPILPSLTQVVELLSSRLSLR